MMLTGNNGILQRATDAKTNSDNSQIQERINIAYHSSLVYGQGKVTETSLETELKNEFNKTILDEGWLDKTSVEGKWKITIDNTSLEVPAGTSDEKTSAINYGSKTAANVSKGDTIEITFGEGTETYTEQFMVLTNDGSIIMAIPYYNITQSTTNPVQSSDISETGTVAFCPSPKFWTEAGVNVEPMSSSNIQQYISAYSTKLSDATNGKVTAEVGRYYGEHALSSFDGQSNSEGKMLLNPGFCGDYWLGSNQILNALYVVYPNRLYLEPVMESLPLWNPSSNIYLFIIVKKTVSSLTALYQI